MKNVEVSKFEQLINEISSLKIDSTKKEDIIRNINDIEIDYDRLKKSSDMQKDVLEKEKKILLDNYIKKDNHVNYLYNKLQEIENSKRWKMVQKIGNLKSKVVKK